MILMKNYRKNLFKILSTVFIFLFVLSPFCLSASAEDDAEELKGEFSSLSELKGKRFGFVVGSIFEDVVKSYKDLSDGAEFVYVKKLSDGIAALQNNKVDAVLTDKPIAQLLVSNNEGITILDEYFFKDNYGFGFAKNSPYYDDINNAIISMKNDGTLDELKKIWVGSDYSKKVLTKQDWKGEKGTLKFWAEYSFEPMSYIGKDGQVTGLEIEIILRAAKLTGYNVEFNTAEISSLLPAVISGKADIIGGSMSITDERKKSIDFSEPHYEGAAVAIIRTADNQSATGIFSKIKNSFNKTFVIDSRWKMFLQGIGTTVFITVLSALFGAFLGFLIFYICKDGNVFANKVTDIIIGILEKTPTVVLLMILYYVIFGNYEIGGVFVSIICFTLTFTASVINILRTSVGAIDKGQSEAALALGFTKHKTFFKIIIPQASVYFLPSLKVELITLIKATAVVGYITVQDLTMMSDIVRSRTFEAFFPIISSALIYFVFATVLTLLIEFLIKITDPKKRKTKNILKGVSCK